MIQGQHLFVDDRTSNFSVTTEPNSVARIASGFLRGTPISPPELAAGLNHVLSSNDVLVEGYVSEKSRGDWTPLELFLAGVQGWEGGIWRWLDERQLK